MDDCKCPCCCNKQREEDRSLIHGLKRTIRDQSETIYAQVKTIRLNVDRAEFAEKALRKAECHLRGGQLWCQQLLAERGARDVSDKQKYDDQRKFQHFELFKAAITGTAALTEDFASSVAQRADKIALAAMTFIP